MPNYSTPSCELLTPSSQFCDWQGKSVHDSNSVAPLARMWQHAELPDPTHIAVDEKSYKKGRKYVTIVSDVERGMVIWVSERNTKSSLDEFFKILGPERCKKIQCASKDMHKPYIASCEEFIPQALEVADSFHVVKKLNEVRDSCRRELIESPDTPKSEKKDSRK